MSSSATHYQFVTQWQIPAPQRAVWNELAHPENWPDWWRGVERVELVRPRTAEIGTGAIRRYVFRSRLPYSLSFLMETTLIEPDTRIEGVASGELEGTGCWQLSHEAGVTHVRYDWRVVANKWWMVWLAPVARPAFEWNHDVVMEWGRQGLLARVSQVASRVSIPVVDASAMPTAASK